MLAAHSILAALLLAQAALSPQPDPQLAAETAEAAELIRPQLPERQGSTAITGVSASGTELILDLVPDAPVDAEFVRRFREALPGIACGNAEARSFLSRGGTYTYRLRDQAGQMHSISIDSVRHCGS